MPSETDGPYGPELLDPGFKKLKLEHAAIRNDCLTLQGSCVFMEKTSDESDIAKALLRFRIYKTDRSIDLPVSLSEVE